MSKEVKRWDELKALAEGMDGWPNKAAFECDDVWFVGAIDEDENLYPVIEIQTEQYDAFDASEPMAKYYAAANPPAILELLAERDALLAERDRLREALKALRAATPSLTCESLHHKRRDLHDHDEACPPFERWIAAALACDAALQGEQPCT